MRRFTVLAAAAAAVLAFSAPAEARRHHHQAQHHHRQAAPVAAATMDNNGHYVGQEAPVQAERPARSRHRQVARPSRPALDAHGNGAGGVVRSGKTGATARVSPSHAAAFQAYVDDLEARGATVRFMGGIRPGHCSSGSQHPCGKALDVCQLSRGVVDHRCHLPGRQAIAAIAASHGLFEGGRWCHSDYGHAQVDVSGGDCGSLAARHHRKGHRVARRGTGVVLLQ